MSTTMSHIFPIQTLRITVEYREVYNASSRKVIIFGSRCHYLFLSTLCGVRYKKRHQVLSIKIPSKKWLIFFLTSYQSIIELSIGLSQYQKYCVYYPHPSNHLLILIHLHHNILKSFQRSKIRLYLTYRFLAGNA